MAASKSQKIQAEIDKVKAKISEQQARLKELEQKHREAENEEITEENEAYKTFLEALTAVCRKLSMMMAGDGEGATKLLICKTTGAKDWETAKTVAKSVICSSLLKAAMFGEDANWGRVLCAIGYAGADIDINKVDVSFKSAYGQVDVCG